MKRAKTLLSMTLGLIGTALASVLPAAQAGGRRSQFAIGRAQPPQRNYWFPLPQPRDTLRMATRRGAAMTGAAKNSDALGHRERFLFAQSKKPSKSFGPEAPQGTLSYSNG